MEECEHVLHLHPEEAVAYAYRARVSCWQGEYGQALADCEQALHLDPACAEAYGVRGLLAFQQHDLFQAQADFEKARDLGHNLFWIEDV